MRTAKCALLLAACVALLRANLSAAEPAEPKTLMTERGKLLFGDDLNQPLGKDWKTAKGKWEVVDGTIRGSELKADMHGAATRHDLPAQNVVIQYSFKLEGAKGTSLSINDDKGHCCRVSIDATGFAVRKDSHDKNVADKAAVLEKKDVAIKPGVWHTLVVEIQGKEMLASLDGEAVAFGANDTIDVQKKNLGLTVAGESVSFKGLRVWEATPNKSWEATRAKLVEARAKAPQTDK